MKTTILTLATIFIIGLSNTALSNTPENIKEIIKKEITYPQFAVKDNIEGTVMVSFMINEGMVDIEVANASNEELKNYVINKLKSLVFNKNEKTKMNMKFEFKIL